MSSDSINLLDLTRTDCEMFVQNLGFKPFHGRNLFKWIHKHGIVKFSDMTDLPVRLREILNTEASIQLPKLSFHAPSLDGTQKWLLELIDGQQIETVLIPEGRRNTICVSSQVGCALNCAFCATARQGFNRNLKVSEIIGQIWQVTRWLGTPPTNVVLMGMGEPLANFSAVTAALEIMQDDLAYMISKQRITLSTVGIVPQIYHLSEVSAVSLAVSLHAPNDELRDQLIPLNRKYPLNNLIPACRNYIARDARRKITWEYVMIQDINDNLNHANQLIKLLSNVPSKLNLIPLNPIAGSKFTASPPERIEAFRQRLMRAGLFTVIRKTRGDAITAACGQLIGRVHVNTKSHSQY